MKRTLFEIGEELLRVYDTIDDDADHDSALTAETESLDEWFAHVQEEEAIKLDCYCSLIMQLTMEQHAAKAEANLWLHKAQGRERRVRWLKDRLMQHLVATGRTEALTASGRKVAVQNDGGAQPLVIETEDQGDLLVIAAEYHSLGLVREKLELDRDAVRKAIERGTELPFAKLAPRGQHLRIR